MKSSKQSSKICAKKVIEDLDVYVRHYHSSGKVGFRVQRQTPAARNALKRLVDVGILSSLESAQLTRQGFEIARQVHRSLVHYQGNN